MKKTIFTGKPPYHTSTPNHTPLERVDVHVKRCHTGVAVTKDDISL